VTRVDVVLLDVQRVTDGEIEVVIEVVGEGLSGSTDGDVISTLLKGADIKEERASKGGICFIISVGDSHTRGDGALSISRGTSNGVLLDKDLDSTAGRGDKDGEGRSIISNGGGLVIESLILVGISDLGESLSFDDLLDGGLVVISVEGELRVGGVLDADKVGSRLSSARSKTDGINDTPRVGGGDRARPDLTVLTPDASIDGSRDVVSGGKVKDEVIASTGKLSRDVDGIAKVSIDRGSLVSVGGVNLIVGSVTVLNAVL